jgi:signal transduction histidine kinase
MIATLQAILRIKLLKSPYFWAIIVINLFLIFVYQAWPWREWQFTDGLWQWFPWLSSFDKLAIVEATNHIFGILFFLPIICAAVFLSWRVALIATLLSLGGVLPVIVDMWSIDNITTNMILLMLPLFVVSIATFELNWRRKERKFFAEREAERRAYTSRVLEAQEEERHRISRDLHDETIQTLLAIANNAETLVSGNNSSEVKRKGAGIRDATLSTVDKLRRIGLELRPNILDQLGLVSALRWLADHMSTECDIHTRIITNGAKPHLPPQVEVNMFRIVQEAFSNIKRHSKANKAVVTLEFAAEHVKMTVEDDGQGFQPPKEISSLASRGKMGLIGIEERVHFLGGTFQIRSRPDAGTSLLIQVKC